VPTHYEVLGVAPDASPAALRAAYLAKARALHPDRQIGRSRAEVERAQRAMQDVNAAWSVLQDPRARRDYDRTLARPEPTAAPVARPVPRTGRPVVVLEELDHGGRALPFLVRVGPVVLLLGVLVVIFVITAFAAGKSYVDPRQYGSIEGVPEVGTCIDAQPLGLFPVACDVAGALRVEQVIEPGDTCAEGAVPTWWEEDVVLCLRPPS
jgi:curved DNA-binding protein CbpA